MAKNEGVDAILLPEERERCELVKAMLSDSNRPKEAVSVFRNAIPAPWTTDRIGAWGKPVASSVNLAKSPGIAGIAVVSNRKFTVGHGAKIAAQAMFALDMVPHEYSCIICHPSENLIDELPSKEILEQFRLKVVYDIDGVFGQGAVDITEGAFTFLDNKFSIDYSKISPLTQAAKRIVYAETIRACRRYFDKETSGTHVNLFTPSYDPVPAMELVAERLSFGKWSFDEIRDWQESITIENIDDFASRAVYNMPNHTQYGDTVYGFVYDETYKKFCDLVAIWKTRFSEYGLSKSVLADVVSNGKAEKLGAQLLVDSYIETYLSGVPVQDLLA